MGDDRHGEPETEMPPGVPERGTDDAFGHMVWEYHHGSYDGSGIYRDFRGGTRDGHPEWYFDTGEADLPVETREALELVREAASDGLVLDLGCGAGAHARLLQSSGHGVLGGDPSVLALRTARARGLEQTAAMDLNALPVRTDALAAVFMCGTQLGNAGGGTVEGLERILAEFDRVVRPGGRVVADLKDPAGHREAIREAENGVDDLVFVDGGVGRRRMRTEYREWVGRWVDLLLLSPDAAAEVVDGTPWELVDTLHGEGSRYYLVLERP